MNGKKCAIDEAQESFVCSYCAEQLVTDDDDRLRKVGCQLRNYVMQVPLSARCHIQYKVLPVYAIH